MDEFEQRSREVARAILEQHGWKRPMTAELKEMRGVVDLPYSECKRYLVEEWQNMRVPLLEKEIEQLRELATGLYKCWANEGCEGCPMQDDGGWCVRDIRLRELGVEV